MDFTTFSESLAMDAPPALSVLLTAMWYDGKGDWHAAHELVNDLSGPDAAWVHAYLHRREGDTGNAGYWYRRASRSFPTVSLEDEWRSIVEYLLR